MRSADAAAPGDPVPPAAMSGGRAGVTGAGSSSAARPAEESQRTNGFAMNNKECTGERHELSKKHAALNRFASARFARIILPGAVARTTRPHPHIELYRISGKEEDVRGLARSIDASGVALWVGDTRTDSMREKDVGERPRPAVVADLARAWEWRDCADSHRQASVSVMRAAAGGETCCDSTAGGSDPRAPS